MTTAFLEIRIPAYHTVCCAARLPNSAWANFGYLVATEISGDDETMKEYRMLHGLHGIGLIRINPKEPPESEIVVYARER